MKKNKKTDIIIFIVILLFSLTIFSKYLTGHFAADTFRIIDIGYEKYATDYSLTDGRLFMGLIGYIAHILNIHIVTYGILLEVLAISTSCITIMVLKNIILKYYVPDNRKQHIFLLIVCYYTIFNFTYFENMYFVECFVMALSILFYILAAHKIIEHNIKDNIKAIMLIILGLISYQGTISAFFIFVILFSMLKKEKLACIIKNFIKAIVIFFIGFLVDNTCIILAEKIFNTTQTRGLKLERIYYNIQFIIKNFLTVLIYTANLFPKFLYIILTCLSSLLICIKMIKQNNKECDAILLEQTTIIVFSIMCAFIPSVMNLSAFFALRMRFSIGATIGLLFIHIIVKTDFLKIKSLLDKLLISIFIIYGIINTMNYINLINLNIQANKLDEYYTYIINDYISDYEEENNIKVKNISIVFINAQISKAFYKEMDCMGVGTAVSAIRTEWASIGAINYYTNRSLKEKQITNQEKEDYLKRVDKSKNFLCMNDTLYISVYMN